MNRVKRGVTAHKKHKKTLEAAKGYYGARSRTYRSAKQAVIKAGQYSYRDRKARKRDFRRLWIARINGALTSYNITYSIFINQLHHDQIMLNRKMISDMAIFNKEMFDELVNRTIKNYHQRVNR